MEKVEELYNTYFHDVYLFLVSVTGNEGLSQDLTQETITDNSISLEDRLDDKQMILSKNNSAAKLREHVPLLRLILFSFCIYGKFIYYHIFN